MTRNGARQAGVRKKEAAASVVDQRERAVRDPIEADMDRDVGVVEIEHHPAVDRTLDLAVEVLRRSNHNAL